MTSLFASAVPRDVDCEHRSPEPRSVIRALPTKVANQIAAGEVVESPASVVKELVENSLDAGATRIDVVTTLGGRRLVSVADNGSGMVRDDALMSLEAHATSRIRTAEELDTLRTMGFRGEAIPSIASVSRFTMRTRCPALDVGTCVEVVGGELRGVRVSGCAPGTLVEVRDLFFNLPCRRKFLRSYMAEQAKVVATFRQLAMSRPDVAFSLRCDGRVVHALAPCETFADRLRDIRGEDFASMAKVDLERHGVHVWGYAGRPDLTRADTSEQHFFVNRRVASAPVLHAALREAYRDIPFDRRPVAFLFIDVPPDAVDVNVHPTKREVRFRSAGAVRDALVRALDAALGAAPACDGVEGQMPENLGEKPASETCGSWQTVNWAACVCGAGRAPVREEQPWTSAVDVAVSRTLPRNAGEPWGTLRFLSVLGPGFVAFECEGGILLVNPREARARVVYEAMMRGQPETRRLVAAQTLELAADDAESLRGQLPLFARMGFEIDGLDGSSFMVLAVPTPLSGSCPSLRGLLVACIDAIEGTPSRNRVGRWREEAVACAASRFAETADDGDGDALGLMSRLAQCEQPYAGPTGRATVVLYSYYEMTRRFGLCRD